MGALVEKDVHNAYDTLCRKTSRQRAFVVARRKSAHVENTGVRIITSLGMDVT